MKYNILILLTILVLTILLGTQDSKATYTQNTKQCFSLQYLELGCTQDDNRMACYLVELGECES